MYESKLMQRYGDLGLNTNIWQDSSFVCCDIHTDLRQRGLIISHRVVIYTSSRLTISNSFRLMYASISSFSSSHSSMAAQTASLVGSI